MLRTPVLFALTASALLAAGCGERDVGLDPSPHAEETRAATPRDAPLNVVLITLDTTRADALGSYGQVLATSPGIDRMAREGVLFERAVTSSPSTLPSHASILTGKQPYAHGVRSNAGYVLSEQNVTLAETLQSRGYRTAAEVSANVIAPRTQLDQGFDQYRTPEDAGVELKTIEIQEPEGLRKVELRERPAADVSERGIEFIRANRDRPFFLWLHYFDAHAPYSAPGPFNFRIPESTYHAEVAYVDQQVDRVLLVLSEFGLKDRTLVVLTADHGEGLQDHGELTHTFYVYESTMHVPLILWGPRRLPAASRIPALVRTIDIAPTILDLLSLPPLEDVQGTSLLPLISGSEQDLALPGYGESFEFMNAFGGSVLRFVREGNWKYLHKAKPALYDVGADPGEHFNLAATEPGRVTRMQSLLRSLVDLAPARPTDAARNVDEATRSELIALGYVGADAPSVLPDERALLEVHPPDPSDQTQDVALFAAARGRLGQGDDEEALEAFTTLWQRNPNSVPTLVGLVEALRRLERDEQAVELLPQVARLAPDRTELFVDLSAMARRTGRTSEAIDAIQLAVAGSPCAPGPRSTLSELLRVSNRSGERLALLESGVAQCPDTPEFKNDLAWVLATNREPALRDGPRALRLSREAVEASLGSNVGFLDTLAAAQAEAGHFEAAVETAERVVALLEQREVLAEQVEIFREHLVEFEAGRPLRDD